MVVSITRVMVWSILVLVCPASMPRPGRPALYTPRRARSARPLQGRKMPIICSTRSHEAFARAFIKSFNREILR